MIHNSAIVTHGDLDGMTSAIMLLKAIGHPAPIRISNGKNLPRDLEQIARLDPLPSDVYISDIPLIRDYHDRFVGATRLMHERGARIHLYDHHFGWRAIQQDDSVLALFTSFHVNESKTTAAKVIFDHLAPDPANVRWLELLSKKDRSEDPAVCRDFALLVALMQRDHFRYTSDVLHRLAFGQPLLPEHEQLARWYFDVQVPREIEAARTAELMTTRSGRRIAWFDMRDQAGYLNISRHAFALYDIDLTAVVLKGKINVGTQSIDKGLDMRFLHGTHTQGGIELSVAGHKSPVAIQQTGTCSEPDFIRAAREFISERL